MTGILTKHIVVLHLDFEKPQKNQNNSLAIKMFVGGGWGVKVPAIMEKKNFSWYFFLYFVDI